MVCHRGKGNNYRSRSIIDAGDAYIELVEEYPCQNKEQLNRREGEIIRSRPNCINKAIAGRTHREWRKDNAGKVSERQKKWADTNKEKVKEAQKKWADANKEKDNEKRRERYRLAKEASETEQKENE
jgi:hypothetical protein